MTELLELPEFRKALERTPEAAIRLTDDTRTRYMRGQLPQVIRWLVRYPVLLEALLRDAQSFVDEQIAA